MTSQKKKNIIIPAETIQMQTQTEKRVNVSLRDLCVQDHIHVVTLGGFLAKITFSNILFVFTYHSKSWRYYSKTILWYITWVLQIHTTLYHLLLHYTEYVLYLCGLLAVSPSNFI